MDKKRTCPDCGGTGMTRFIFRSENEPIRPYDLETCEMCQGTGILPQLLSCTKGESEKCQQ